MRHSVGVAHRCAHPQVVTIGPHRQTVRVTADAVPDLGTILSVWAHPDDETYGCAGIMAASVRAGRRVVCVTATRGEQGSTNPDRWPPGPDLAAVRTAELEACLAELGVDEHHWLDYPDGGCADADQREATERIAALVAEVRPDTILTFGPDGGTWHPDHIAVSKWATAASDGTGAAVHYASTTPEWLDMMSSFMDASVVMMADKQPLAHPREQLSIHVVLDGELLEMKYRAMLRQQSQIEPMMALIGEDNLRRMLAEESFRDAGLG